MKRVAYFVLAALAVIATFVAVRQHFAPPPAVVSPVAPELRASVTQPVVVAPVQAFPAKKKAELGLPAAVAHDDNKVLLGAVRTPVADCPQTVTAVLDKTTGETTLYTRIEPLPWLDTKNHGEISLSRGVRSGDFVYRLSANAQVLKIKAVALGVVGSLDSDGQWYAGFGVSYRW